MTIEQYVERRGPKSGMRAVHWGILQYRARNTTAMIQISDLKRSMK